MIKLGRIIIILVSVIFLVSCSNKYKEVNNSSNGVSIIDAFGNEAVLNENPRVVSCYGSFSECWMLSGGTLCGVTDDATEERKLDLSSDVQIIGTVKNVNLESIVALMPDYVILSADVAAQAPLKDSFDALGIQYGYFRVDSFEDYSDLMRSFCFVNGRDDLYQKYVEDVEKNISDILSKPPHDTFETYLLMRVYSTGIKVKTDNIADMIIKDLGGKSITDNSPSLLTDLSVEEVIRCNPDHIFVLTMGDEKAGEKYFTENIAENPAWSGLSAIKNGNYHMLPKELFHYKPNNRWDESYKYIAEILYPEIYE